MAERRMFAKTIIDSDAFLDMPLSSQALYFHLSMRADDDGFINNPKKVQRMIGCSDDDLKLLVAKRFIIPFESGIVVIKHWKIHNYIQKDRYKETMYKDEKALLSVKENNAYTLAEAPCIQAVSIPDTDCIPAVSGLDTQDRLGKDRLESGKSQDRERVDYQRIADMYNETCVSFPRLVSLSEVRKKAIRARLNTYTVEQIGEVFRKAEASRFLKGGNDRSWSATFDWIMKDANFAKILEGNYDDRGNGSRQQQKGGNIFLEMGDQVF